MLLAIYVSNSFSGRRIPYLVIELAEQPTRVADVLHAQTQSHAEPHSNRAASDIRSLQ